MRVNSGYLAEDGGIVGFEAEYSGELGGRSILCWLTT